MFRRTCGWARQHPPQEAQALAPLSSVGGWPVRDSIKKRLAYFRRSGKQDAVLGNLLIFTLESSESVFERAPGLIASAMCATIHRLWARSPAFLTRFAAMMGRVSKADSFSETNPGRFSNS